MVSLASAFPGGFKAKPPQKSAYVSMIDPRAAFVDHLRECGYLPPTFLSRTDISRFPAPGDKPQGDAGWAVYYEFPDTFNPGGNIGVGVYGDWRTGARETWVSKRAESMSHEERAALSGHIEEAKRLREEAQARLHAETAIMARTEWETLQPVTSHPYLDAKRIKPHGARVKGDALVIPVCDASGIVSLQYIWPDKKRFMTGGKTRGCYYIIPGTDKSSGNSAVYVCEGFATGATIADATGAMVYVAFNAGNLIDVTQAAKAAHPQARIIVAGDDDVNTEGNPGRAKATAAADMARCDVVFPVVPTDFNDMACAGHDVAEALVPKGRSQLFASIGELLAMPDRIDWTVRDIIERNAFGMIFGAPGVGKSFVAIDLAASIATGQDWHGRSVSKGAVVYIAGEGYQGITRRFRAWAMRRGVPLDSAPVHISRNAIAMGDTNALYDAIREIDKMPQRPQFIVVDTVARAMVGLDENSATDMGAFVAACDKLRTGYDATLIAVHHSGHAEKQRARGSSALRAAIDCEILVAPQTDGIRLTCTKAKDAEPFAPIHFALETVTIGTDEGGDSISSAVLALRDTPSPKKIQPTGKNQRAVLDTLRRLILESGEDEIDEATLRRECGVDAKRFGEAKQSLLETGLISFDGGSYSIADE